LVDIFIAETDTIKQVDGFLPSLILQIITKDEISAFRKHGGNALGISEDEGPLLCRFLQIWNIQSHSYRLEQYSMTQSDTATPLTTRKYIMPTTGSWTELWH
jgi:hypothetical protein